MVLKQDSYLKILLVCSSLVFCTEGASSADCEHGHYLSNGVCMLCPQQCHTCTSSTNCAFCKDRFYGEQCSNPCPSHCKICSETGACTSCEERYFLNGDQCNQCPENCTSCSSVQKCLHCKAGFKGRTCQEACENCTLGTECTQETGRCSSGCKDGLSGIYCNVSCNSACQSCEPSAANRCIHCASGMFGINCVNRCSETCVNKTCNETDGTCPYGCEIGYWGRSCKYECAPTCKGATCARLNGTCTNGCFANLTGDQCTCPSNCSCDENGLCTMCDPNSNVTCGENCKGNCFGDMCLRYTGHCLFECLVGYAGLFCEESRTEKDREHILIPLFVISLSIVTLMMLSSTVYRGCQVYRRKKALKGSESPSPETESMMEKGKMKTSGVLQDSYRTEICKEDTHYIELKSDKPENTTSENVPLDDLEKYLKNKTKGDFEREFKRLPSESSSLETYLPKNADYVGSKVLSIIFRKYLNASFIGGYTRKRDYIVCSGPTIRTVLDRVGNMPLFWSMIWEEMCDRIGMLTNLQEESITKCYKYWPDVGEIKTYGDITVQSLGETMKFDHFEYRKFEIYKDDKYQPRLVEQLQFTAWPEKNVPINDDVITSLIQFRRKLNRSQENGESSILIHCSDGMGRTGTYIAWDSLISKASAEGAVNMFACVANLRQQRPGITNLEHLKGKKMVDNVEQYMFIHKALLYWHKHDKEVCEPTKC